MALATSEPIEPVTLPPTFPVTEPTAPETADTVVPDRFCVVVGASILFQSMPTLPAADTSINLPDTEILAGS